jgi:hypothetical protein
VSSGSSTVAPSNTMAAISQRPRDAPSSCRGEVAADGITSRRGAGRRSKKDLRSCSAKTSIGALHRPVS